jgi:hypothetical protein
LERLDIQQHHNIAIEPGNAGVVDIAAPEAKVGNGNQRIPIPTVYDISPCG